MIEVRYFLNKRKYILLLFALIQHLFVGIVLHDMDFYVKVIWPINMLILGIASVGVFIEKGRFKNTVRNILFLLVFTLPISLSFIQNSPNFMIFVSTAYVLFFLFIFLEIVRFLIKPSYINTDIISASACGYFLLIEVCVFLMQIFFILILILLMALICLVHRQYTWIWSIFVASQ
jgi:hypothetical protein